MSTTPENLVRSVL